MFNMTMCSKELILKYIVKWLVSQLIQGFTVLFIGYLVRFMEITLDFIVITTVMNVKTVLI